MQQQDKQQKREIMKIEMANKTLRAELDWANSWYRRLVIVFATYFTIALTLTAEEASDAFLKALIPTGVILLLNLIGLRIVGKIFARIKKDT